MRTITCLCERSFEADLPEDIDLDAEPGRIREILDGGFFAVSCPSCGTLLKPELELRFGSKKHGLDLTVIPEAERLDFYRGKRLFSKDAEILIGYAELFERARIIDEGLDAEAIEILKYWLAQKAAEASPEAEAYVSFAGREGEGLTFHVRGLREGEVAVLRVGADIYESALAGKAKSLRSAPFDRIFAGHYRSIRILDSETEID
jgi:hypothetical protein